jgi:hypothetical protein
VRASENNAAGIGPVAEWLAYLGVVPFVLCLAGVGLLPGYAGRELAQRIALGWGAALLAGTGAVHLGLALAGQLPARRTGGALVAPLLAAAAVVLERQRGLALLVIGSGGFWLYEHRSLGALLPEAYIRLRRPLTLATCLLLALTLFVSDAAGLG